MPYKRRRASEDGVPTGTVGTRITKKKGKRFFAHTTSGKAGTLHLQKIMDKVQKWVKNISPPTVHKIKEAALFYVNRYHSVILMVMIFRFLTASLLDDLPAPL